MLDFIDYVPKTFLGLPLLYVLARDVSFNEDYRRVIDQLKLKLTATLVVQPSNWALPFEPMRK